MSDALANPSIINKMINLFLNSSKESFFRGTALGQSAKNDQNSLSKCQKCLDLGLGGFSFLIPFFSNTKSVSEDIGDAL